jgi:hypothetical protein
MEFERWIYNESWPVYDTLALEMFFLKKKNSLLLLLQFVFFSFLIWTEGFDGNSTPGHFYFTRRKCWKFILIK